ncbi:major facilitator superfamily transporter [Grosmannia clavigera kw1407]|uniref:Major facilitator superfamily transporter n=1 Tax=Grosmannia clavigera (strain kw1407 / UAMH 11150) TaxID=655863 RepID=F0XFF9_GROCL|nr:major facilitator superfamily transporter [Grosmannia clavigera kw1407]EFX04014.1 major facilitator superfamily transporter [Grosmannia clavigera kw1407]
MGAAFLDAGAGSGSTWPARPRAVGAVGAVSSDDLSDSQSSTRLLTPDGSDEKDEADVDEEEEEDGRVHVELQRLHQTRRRRPSSGRHGRLAYTAEEERAVVRKFDRRLVLFVALLYMLSFLDRSNIGNARIAGMDDDLQTTPPRDSWYAWCLTAFYAAYIAFEWMALLWHVLPAHVYVAALVLGWGLAASLQAVATSYPGLIVLRLFLGIGEAGFAGIPLYLARFFRRDELALRMAVFIAAAPLATTFAAALAWAILALARRVASPIAPWRLLFLIEGFPSVLAAVAAWRILPDAPDRARYLTRHERRLARARLDDGNSEDDTGNRSDKEQPPTTTWLSSLAVLADPVAWITAAMFFLANMAYSSLPVFLPTILAAMGHDPVTAQAMSAPPYLAAFVVVLATAHTSDRIRSRSPLLIAHALASAAGYAALSLRGTPNALRYAAVYPAAVGFFNVVVLLITWNLNNQPGQRRQGCAFALFQVVGQCGPLVGTRLYPDADRPLFLRGMRTMAGAMLAVAALAVVLRLVLRRRNRMLDVVAATADDMAEMQLRNDNDDDDDETERGAYDTEEEEEDLVGETLQQRRHQKHTRICKSRVQVPFRYML